MIAHWYYAQKSTICDPNLEVGYEVKQASRGGGKGPRPSVRPSACDLVTGNKPSVSHKIWCSKSAQRKRYFKNLNKTLSTDIPHLIWKVFGTADIAKNVPIDYVFREVRWSESHNLYKSVNGFIRTVHIYFRDLHVEVFSICKVRANRRRECHTFFTDVNNNTFKRVR